MPRDVLTLDVELNPSNIVQQTSYVRNLVAQQLNAGPQMGMAPVGMGAYSPSFQQSGMPYTGMAPGVQGFPSPGIMSGFGQFVSPLGYAAAYGPVTTPPAEYAQALGISSTARVTDWFASTAVTAAETGAEVAGGAVGAFGGYKFGASLGQKLLGVRGGLPGGIAGAILGGLAMSSVAGSLVEETIGQIPKYHKESMNLMNTLTQFGFRANMGRFLTPESRDMAFQATQGMVDIARSIPEVSLLGLDPRKFSRSILQPALQMGLFEHQERVTGVPREGQDRQSMMIEQLGYGSTADREGSGFLGRFGQLARMSFGIAETFGVTINRTMEVAQTLHRMGAITPSQIQEQVEMAAGSRFEFQTTPTEFLMASKAGVDIARQFGFTGQTGLQSMQEAMGNITRMRRDNLIDTETIHAAGGVPRLAAAQVQTNLGMMGRNQIGENLLFAAMDDEGNLNEERYRELVNKNLSPMEILTEAQRRLGKAKDPVQLTETFQYRRRDLLRQAPVELRTKATMGIMEQYAERLAQSTGREVTDATRFNALTNFMGMPEHIARAMTPQLGRPSRMDLSKVRRMGQENLRQTRNIRESSLIGFGRRTAFRLRERIFGGPADTLFDQTRRMEMGMSSLRRRIGQGVITPEQAAQQMKNLRGNRRNQLEAARRDSENRRRAEKIPDDTVEKIARDSINKVIDVLDDIRKAIMDGNAKEDKQNRSGVNKGKTDSNSTGSGGGAN
jgi:soluble cytochrome b562